MGFEKWLAIASVGLFALFIGNMISVYLFMTDVPEDFEFAIAPKVSNFTDMCATKKY